MHSQTDPSDAKSSLVRMLDVKVIFVGDSGVGKTSIIGRMRSENYFQGTQPTVGGSSVSIEAETTKGNLRFIVWDTAGQEEFRSILPLYFRDAAACLIVFSVTDSKSFENVKEWLEVTRNAAPPSVAIGLLGNKSDCDTDRQVSCEEGAQKSEKLELAFYCETSAVTGQNIEEILPTIAGHVQLEKRKAPSVIISEAPARTDQSKQKCC
jgi:small GTP-binding protein